MEAVERAAGGPVATRQVMIQWTLIRANHAVVRRVSETLASSASHRPSSGCSHSCGCPGVSQAELARGSSSPRKRSAAAGLARTPRPRPAHAGTAGDRHLGRDHAIRISSDGSGDAVARSLNTPARLGLTPSEATQLQGLLHKIIQASSTDADVADA
jgi:hypothetical protein